MVPRIGFIETFAKMHSSSAFHLMMSLNGAVKGARGTLWPHGVEIICSTFEETRELGKKNTHSDSTELGSRKTSTTAHMRPLFFVPGSQSPASWPEKLFVALVSVFILQPLRMFVWQIRATS